MSASRCSSGSGSARSSLVAWRSVVLLLVPGGRPAGVARSLAVIEQMAAGTAVVRVADQSLQATGGRPVRRDMRALAARLSPSGIAATHAAPAGRGGQPARAGRPTGCSRSRGSASLPGSPRRCCSVRGTACSR